MWNKKQGNEITAAELIKDRPKSPQVVVRVKTMDEQRARRLTTAVDALLAELVRQETGRSGSS